MDDLSPDYEDDLPFELVTMIKAVRTDPDTPECIKEIIELINITIPLIRKLKILNADPQKFIEGIKMYDKNITRIMYL